MFCRDGGMTKLHILDFELWRPSKGTLAFTHFKLQTPKLKISSSGRGDSNRQPWRRRRHALAGLQFLQVPLDAARLDLSLLLHGFITGGKVFNKDKFPWYAEACCCALASVVLDKTVCKVLGMTDVETAGFHAAEDVNVKHCCNGSDELSGGIERKFDPAKRGRDSQNEKGLSFTTVR